MLPAAKPRSPAPRSNSVDQRCGRRLAVGSGDAQDLPPEVPEGQFDLGQNGDSGLAALVKHGQRQRHAGTDDHEIARAEAFRPVTAEFEDQLAGSERALPQRGERERQLLLRCACR